jgi:hypothetical protein
MDIVGKRGWEWLIGYSLRPLWDPSAAELSTACLYVIHKCSSSDLMQSFPTSNNLAMHICTHLCISWNARSTRPTRLVKICPKEASKTKIPQFSTGLSKFCPAKRRNIFILQNYIKHWCLVLMWSHLIDFARWIFNSEYSVMRIVMLRDRWNLKFRQVARDWMFCKVTFFGSHIFSRHHRGLFIGLFVDKRYSCCCDCKEWECHPCCLRRKQVCKCNCWLLDGGAVCFNC